MQVTSSSYFYSVLSLVLVIVDPQTYVIFCLFLQSCQYLIYSCFASFFTLKGRVVVSKCHLEHRGVDWDGFDNFELPKAVDSVGHGSFAKAGD